MKLKSLPAGRVALGGVLALTALLVVRPAFAQGVLPGVNSNGILTGPVVGSAPAPAPGKAAPAALPGARAGAGTVAPLERPPSEMGPNEALFDAINRGDVNAARDALSRGADLNARNVLGLTPAELSIDLGRNDITFLLLSAGGQGGGVAPAPAQAAKPEKTAGERQKPARAALLRAVAARAGLARRAAAPPIRYADVPATPDPKAGFLGFGGASPR